MVIGSRCARRDPARLTFEDAQLSGELAGVPRGLGLRADRERGCAARPAHVADPQRPRAGAPRHAHARRRELARAARLVPEQHGVRAHVERVEQRERARHLARRAREHERVGAAVGDHARIAADRRRHERRELFGRAVLHLVHVHALRGRARCQQHHGGHEQNASQQCPPSARPDLHHTRGPIGTRAHERKRRQSSPSLRMRARSVCGFTPSSAAAPPPPSIRPRVRASAASMWRDTA